MTTTDTVTKAQIEQLRTEAGAAGDFEQVRLCDLALLAFGRVCGVSYADPDGGGVVTCILPEHDTDETPHEHDRERAENALEACVRAISPATGLR
jgi:hypothetical protein